LVRVRLFAAAKAAAGRSDDEVAAGTIEAISHALVSRYPDLSRVMPSCSFLIDGLQPPEPRDRAEVPAGAVLDVLPPFAGG